MLASLDPLGLPLATQIVEGNQADDPLYEPAIKQVRKLLNKQGVLYVADCKMAAISNRASIENANDYYLMPLPTTIVSNKVLDSYLIPAYSKNIEPIYRFSDNYNSESQQIAEGFELTEIKTREIDGKPISWTERRLIIRSIQHAEAEEKSLYKRLEKAKLAINNLIRPRSGYKCIKALDSFWIAADDIITRYKVKGLLNIKAIESNIKRRYRSYANKPARIETKTVLNLEVEDNKLALEATLKRLGWRVYATNAPIEKLSLDDAVIAYRNEYLIERSFGRLKGKPLSLSPMYLQKDDHATGLIRLLTIGLRVLTLLEFVVRGELFKTNTDITGLYAGNPKRRTRRPTAELLLGAFNYVDLVITNRIDGTSYHLTKLSSLQQHILDLLGFSPTIYTQLENQFS
jgi:transposase